MYYATQVCPETAFNYILVSFFLGSDISIDNLHNSIRRIIDKNEVFRLSITAEDDGPKQYYRDSTDFSIINDPVFFFSDEEHKEKIEEIIASSNSLSLDKMCEFYPFQYSDGRTGVILKMHHLVSDGWTFELMGDYLRDELNGISPEYPAGTILESLNTENNYLESNRFIKDGDFWRNYLADYKGGFEFGQSSTYISRRTRFSVPETIEKRMLAFCEQENLSIYQLFFYLIKILVYLWSGKTDFLIGTVAHGRNSRSLKQSLGLYLKTFPVRFRFDPHEKIGVSNIKNDINPLFRYYNYPYNEIVKITGVKDPLQIIFSHEEQSSDVYKIAHFIGYELYPLVFHLNRRGENRSLLIDIERQVDVVSEEFVKSLAPALLYLFEQLETEPDKPISDYNLCRPGIKTTKEINPAFTIPNVLNNVFVEAKETDIAIKSDDYCLSYPDLRAKVNSVAAFMNRLGVKKGDRVIVASNREGKTIPALLGVLCAGAEYVPIDINAPSERIDYIINDCGASLVLCGDPAARSFSIPAYSFDEALNSSGVSDFQIEKAGPKDGAYIIYTSGSTGKPKGVRVLHANLISLVCDHGLPIHIDSSFRGMVFHSLTFDASIFELFSTLFSRACLYIVSKRLTFDPEKTIKYISENKITHMVQVPSSLYNLTAALKRSPGIKLSLKYIFYGGESLDLNYLKYWKENYPGIKFINIYGPTETTVFVSTKEINDEDINRNISNIGKPIKNSDIILLNSLGKVVPRGWKGEITIGGAGVSSGYINRPELTAEKFIVINNGRYYKSGDYGQVLSSGDIEFLGRIDDQVKVRGYRIELGEVEAAILKYPSVERCAVVVMQEPQALLAAAVKIDNIENVSLIKEWLAEKLPSYMVPSIIVCLEDFPITGNFKVDRKKVVSLIKEKQKTGGIESRSGGPLEKDKLMASVWMEVIHCPMPGPENDFFALGGDSIKAIQCAGKLRKLGYEIAVSDFIDFPRFNDLVSRLRILKKQKTASVKEYPLTPAQKWFFARNLKNPNEWTQFAVFKTANTASGPKIRGILEDILQNAEAFRTAYRLNKDGYYSANILDRSSKLEIERAKGRDFNAIAANLAKQIDIENGDLLKAVLCDYDGETRLILCAHHLAVDGVSWRIIADALGRLRSGGHFSEGVPFSAWAAALDNWRRENYSANKNQKYWSDVFQQKKLFEKISNEEEFTEHKAVFMEDSICSAELNELNNQGFRVIKASLEQTIIAVFMASCFELFGTKNLLVFREGHGREGGILDMRPESTIGWFTTINPMIFDRKRNFEELLVQAKEQVNNIPHKGLSAPDLLGPLPFSANKIGQPGITFNFLGEIAGDNSNDFALLEIGAYSSPENMIMAGLEFNSWLMNGDLHYQFKFGRIDNNKANSITDIFRDNLISAVERLRNIEGRIFSPSEFHSPFLPQSDLNQILEKYDAGNIKRISRLTPLENGIILQNIRDPAGTKYREQVALEYSGKISIDQLNNTINNILKNNENLNSRFVLIENERFYKVILKNALAKIETAQINQSNQLYISDYIAKRKKRSFDLESGPLIRLLLISCPDGKNVLLLEFHHIILDGWSVSLLLEQLYEGLNGRELSLVSPGLRDYELWLEDLNRERAKSFWKDYYKNYDSPPTAIPPLYNSKKAYSAGWGEYSFSVNLSNRIKYFSEAKKCSESLVLQNLWGSFLSRINNSDDLSFGYISAVRPAELLGIDRMLGLLINALPFRFRANGSFSDVCVRSSIPDGFNAYPLYEIEKVVGVKLFNHLFVVENYPFDYSRFQGEGDNVNFTAIKTLEETEYPLNIAILPGDQYKFMIYFDCRKYSLEYLLGFFDAFEGFSKNILADPEMPLRGVRLVSEITREYLIRKSLGKLADSPGGTLAGLFRAAAEKYAGKTALVQNDRKVTYGELLRMAETLAIELLDKVPGKPGLVVVIMDRSIEGFAGILACVLSGVPYAPVDWDYPEGRIKIIIDICCPSAALTVGVPQNSILEDIACPVIDLQNFDFCQERNRTAFREIASKDTAYIIFTSGSSGKPKGAEISNRAILNTIAFYQRTFSPGPEDITPISASPGFDALVLEFWPLILSGAEIHIVPPDIRLFPERIKEWIIDRGITMAFFTTPIAEKLLTESWPRDFSPLKKLLTGGDALHIRPGKKLPFQVFNLYGPTEASVFCSAGLVDPFSQLEGVIRPDIGKPIDNMRLYIFDNNRDLCPDGVVGELYIAGPGVGKGYYNSPDLTSEVFLEDPYFPGSAMYKSGDLARRLPNGALDFVARIDDQIKVRGNRVEPAEIESRLMNFPELSGAAVIANKDKKGAFYLMSFVSVKQESRIDVREIRRRLSSELPLYMVPSEIEIVDKIPTNANGKVDIAALRKIETCGDVVFVAPSNDREAVIIEIWEEILGKQKISAKDNFFTIGGDSLKAVQVYGELSRSFELPMNAVFEYETPELLASHIERKQISLTSRISRIAENDKLLKKNEYLLTKIENSRKSYERRCQKKLEEIKPFLNQDRIMDKVFITGGTGFLGAHLIRRLVENNPDIEIYALTRSTSDNTADDRLAKSLDFYFGRKWTAKRRANIKVVEGSLEKEEFGTSDFQKIADSVDNIFHSAALVKHYGKYDLFFRTNVQGTYNVLELANRGRKKDVHHISTMSVGIPGLIEDDVFMFTEFHHFDVDWDNNYIKTKMAAETVMLDERQKGVAVNIYRVGNLMFDSKTGVFQKNIGENAFYTALKSYYALGLVPDIRNKIFDLSFIDYVADAIVRLAGRSALADRIFHIFNPNFISLREIGHFFNECSKPLNIVPYPAFIEALYKKSEDPVIKPYIHNLLLHSHILDNPHITGFVQKCDKTLYLLSELGFKWPEVNAAFFAKMLKHCDSAGFFEV